MNLKQERALFAAMICVLSNLGTAVMGVFSRLLGPAASPFTLMLFVSLVMFFATATWALREGIATLKTKRIGLHCVRGLVGILSYLCLFMALRTTPLIDAMLLSNTSPLWIPLIALIWLKTKMRKEIWITCLIGFIGVVAILKPNEGIFLSGSFFALLSGVLSSISFIVVARLKTTEPTTRILFYFSLFGIVTLLPFGVVIPSWTAFWFLLSAGVSGFLSSALLAYSFTHGKASTLAPLIYTTVVFSGIFDWLIWDHVPGLLTCLGIMMVIGAGILSIHFEQRYQKKLINLPK
jgi:drug/metabolite transporter (DMT)-like permease